MAEGGRHLDAAIVATLRDVLAVLGAILEDGRRPGVFAPAHPLVTQMGIVAPLLLFAASAPARERFSAIVPRDIAVVSRDVLVALRRGRDAGGAPARRLAVRVLRYQETSMTRSLLSLMLGGILAAGSGVRRACRRTQGHRASGYVDATDVRIAAEGAGPRARGERDEGRESRPGRSGRHPVDRGFDLALQRAQAERRQAEAQLRLLRAGSRPEDVRQAEAQVAAAAADEQAADAELSRRRS